MKKEIAKLISMHCSLKSEKIEELIEIPPSSELGDYAFPCFQLAKEFKKNPINIAEDLSKKIEKKDIIKAIEPKSGYLNFFINEKKFAEETLKQAGEIERSHTGTIVIDLSSPNIAKPFGIGHLRSTIIGNSISEICKSVGFKVVKINYLGDWGTQFGKLIVGYKRFGDDKKLKQDPIQELLRIYVKANSEEYEQEARDWFKKMEQGDKEALRLWKKFKDYSLKDFQEIYELLNIKFDVLSGESLYNKKMEEVIKELEKKNLLVLSRDAKIIDLEKEGLGVVLIQKTDGTGLYATRDIAAAIDRHNKFKFDKMLYDVGGEQKLYFKQLFRVLELMGYEWAKNMVHIDHGLYLGKDGKRFATRKGKTVFMRDVWEEVYENVKSNLEKREKLSKKEIEKRALIITRASIFYADLSNYRSKDTIFNIDKMTEFEGDTGPYLLYSYARANSILNKSKKKPVLKIPAKLESIESQLIKKMSLFSGIVDNAYKQFSPNLIANYSFELASIFNEFYHKIKVIGEEEEGFRLKLVESFRAIMKKSLSLLGIDVLEKM